MRTQQTLGVDKNNYAVIKLPRSLTAIETFGFGLCGLLSWFTSAPFITSGLGMQGLWLWVPATIMGVMLCFQVQALGKQWPDVAGGTANYTSRLLKNLPFLGRYAALGYFVAWGSFPINAVMLTELIKAQLEPWGIHFPEMVMKIGLTILLFTVAFSGTRALAILHLCFIIPAVGLVLLFSIQGLIWLAFSPHSIGFFPSSLPSFSFVELPKWFFFVVYAIYSIETGAAFVADSQKPHQTLRLLSVAGYLIPIISLGGSWVLMRLASNPELQGETFKTFLVASPFWGNSASLIVTLLICSSCLLGAATAVANTPRILYQLAQDGQLSPVFTVVSSQGVLQPALIFTFIFSLFYLLWTDLNSLVIVITISYLLCIITFHFGLWLNRGKPGVRWPWFSLAFCLVEIVALLVGGLAWDWRNLVAGLMFPLIILIADAAIRRISFPPFHIQWWMQRRQLYSTKIKDFVGFQVGILVGLICSTVMITWIVKEGLEPLPGNTDDNLLAVLLMILSFMGVAIACWTTLPQIASIAEAREAAESRFITALDTVPDTVLVLDENGIITQANPAAEVLLELNINQLIGVHLNKFFADLDNTPAYWQSRSEQILQNVQSKRIIETTISNRVNRQRQEYIVFLRDISDRKQAEQQLLDIKNLYQQILDAIPDLVLCKGAESRIIYANKAFREYYGMTLDQLRGIIDAPFAKPDYTQQYVKDDAYVFNTGKTLVTEETVIRYDGEERLFNTIKTAIFDAQQQVIQTVGVSRDISDSKKAEEALRQQTAALEQTLLDLQQTQTQLIQTEKMSSLGQLVAGVAHEINNPVNFIHGNLTHIDRYTQDLLSLIQLYQEIYPEIAAEIQDLSTEIDLDFLREDLPKTLVSMKVGTQRIREIVLTLRNFSRLDEAEMKPVNIHQGIDSTLLILQNRLKAKPEHPPIEIIKEYGNLPDVECYAGQLNQVFMNIFSNAIDALDNYNSQRTTAEINDNLSKITIRTQVINPHWVGISIQDNGPGMAESVKQRLFDPFFTTKPVGQGTGLGLSISYQIIVDKHQGKMKCISEPGKGAEFWIEIPIKNCS
ncbi:MAG: amino acid permease [Aulosira sp. ZfuVER01]|nr:PAS domain S-box protein [Aulosira sp. ZfuVER01]MDZ8000676.1 PAS domain S-box protein [Aulosira sp. DedVER01a]MDZ8051791.1 PAS domain S-box protein [Aulosira sp. ZfuCHP01]